MSVETSILRAVDRKTICPELEGKARRLKSKSAILETTSAQLFGEIVQSLDIMLDSRSVVLGDNDDITQRLALNHVLSIVVGELGSGPIAYLYQRM